MLGACAVFDEYVYVQSPAEYANRILVIDEDQLEESTNYSACFAAHGFEIVRYVDDLWFRINYEETIKSVDCKLVVLAKAGQYVPYDLQKQMSPFIVSLINLFPRLDSEVIAGKEKRDYDLLSQAYLNNFDDYKSREKTEQFLREFVYTKKNVELFLAKSLQKLLDRMKDCSDYKEWFAIAEEKAQLDVLAVKYQCFLDTTEINQCFKNYVLSQYGKLSTCLDSTGPVLVSRAMEYMKENNVRPYDEVNGTGVIRHIISRVAFFTDEIMVCIVINADKIKNVDVLVERLVSLNSDKLFIDNNKHIASISLNINREKNNVILGMKTECIYGKSAIQDKIGDILFNISPVSFFQVNPIQTKKLYDTVVDFADFKGDETVYDLYCGKYI